jgi:coproporphyrinogen III oxidase-like Fe-S oxidoreductase
MKDLSIYINFPFCRQKCHFCDWVQRVPKKDLFLGPESDIRKNYVESLCKEIYFVGSDLAKKGYKPKVVYWGGGTATTATKIEVDKIVTALKATFDLSSVSEWTIEGSPDTISLESLSHFKEHGFDRFSCGIQSFNETRLRSLGRRHNVQQSFQAIETAKEAGFGKISVDLMCGFLDEKYEEIRENIKIIKAIDIKQLSLYTFRPTEGTILRRQLDKNECSNHSANQVKSYEYGRKLLTEYDYNEYGLGYFGDIAENVVAMFSLACDVVGFGSGAISILEGIYCGHTSGLLHGYIKDPFTYDYKVRAVTSPGVLLSFLRSGLSIYQGLRSDYWLERFGESMEISFSRENISAMIDIFKKTGDLKIEIDKAYLSKDKAPFVLIGLINGAMLSNKKTLKENLDLL